jgi:hypothetical protein
MTPFTQIGGVRAGKDAIHAFSATWPFASLQIADAALTITCLRRRWIISKGSIQRLSQHTGQGLGKYGGQRLGKVTALLPVGLRIEHSQKGCNPFIVFWTYQFATLRQELEQRGYSVS